MLLDWIRDTFASLLPPNRAPDQRWGRATVPMSPFRVGPQSFEWYLQRESNVRVSSVSEISDWLRGCTYERDQVQFGVAEFWQHPADFEHKRRGDCEDHALWGWRKLLELGFEAEFVIGRFPGSGDPRALHAWVLLRGVDGRWELFETTAKGFSPMRRSLAAVGSEYMPHYGVGRACEATPFVGLLMDLKRGSVDGVPSPAA